MSNLTSRTNSRRVTVQQTTLRRARRVDQIEDRVVVAIAEEDKEGLEVAEEEADSQLIENATSLKETTKRKTLPIQLLWLNLAEPSNVRKIWLSMITTTRRLAAQLLPKSESFEEFLRNLCVQNEGFCETFKEANEIGL